MRPRTDFSISQLGLYDDLSLGNSYIYESLKAINIVNYKSKKVKRFVYQERELGEQNEVTEHGGRD